MGHDDEDSIGFDRTPKDPKYDERRSHLYNRGNDYQRLGTVLFGVGASIATASTIYWFLSPEQPATTASVQPRPGGATFAVRSKF